MKSLGDLLKLRKIPGVREAEVRQICAAALSRVSGVMVQPKQVRYNDGAVFLSVAPVLKSALVMKFEETQHLLSQEGITLREIR